MKTGTKVETFCIVIALLCVYCLGVHVAFAQLKTGNLAQEVRRIADQDTDRFLTALEDTTNEFPWEAGQKSAWWNLFKAKLGLDGYASNAENVEMWERIRAALKTKYTSSDVDTLLDGAIGGLTPLSEGEGE